VHARSVAAAAIDGVTGEVFKTRLGPDPQVVLDWIGGLPGPVAVAYEAGPTGYGLARTVRAAGVRCEVVAPSKLARPSGDRVKTDAGDAMHLARLLRLDEYTPVRVPTKAQESARDLVRAREGARSDLMRSRHRVWQAAATRDPLLRREGLDRAARRVAAGQRFDLAGTRAAFEDAYETVVLTTGRGARLDKEIAVLAEQGEYVGVASRLACLRGISTLTSVALAVEIGQWDRFTGSSIGAYLGLVPTEASSGTKRSQGGITKTGNAHVRRLLVEAAWHHRRPYRPTAILRRRWEHATPAAVARAQDGNHRLHRRWVGYAERKKRPVLANVAVARELAVGVSDLGHQREERPAPRL